MPWGNSVSIITLAATVNYSSWVLYERLALEKKAWIYTSFPCSCNNVLLRKVIDMCTIKIKWPLNMCLQDLLLKEIEVLQSTTSHLTLILAYLEFCFSMALVKDSRWLLALSSFSVFSRKFFLSFLISSVILLVGESSCLSVGSLAVVLYDCCSGI